MTNLTATDRHGHEWELIPMRETICARKIVEKAATPTVLNADQLLTNHGPLLLSTDRPMFSVGTWDSLVDVVDLVATDPETATIEQIRKVASVAQLMLATTPHQQHIEAVPMPRPLPHSARASLRSLEGGPW
ncbi:hypothetical protein JWS13_05250 (plasmid) [Rhodococcus pseudokoreensis]|uniref:Uncharacterized protein n=1 Tax=Rhodococcus pseudokoreensis TaxID=2811421 RepID=A0A974VYS4_9NOCA|nr:hypothetical protein [Rhodococcus pseudokoreensis]QSE88063.1 hypothetical protein JWS13_05250 [Rhodococcus pseudokoreensis]